MDQVQKVTIFISGSSISTSLQPDELAQFISALQLGKEEWLTIDSGALGKLVLSRSQVIGIKIHKSIAASKGLPGVSVREICRVAPNKWKYPTLVRKVNRPGGIELEMASDRRILLTEKNLRALHLSESEANKLKDIEARRLSNRKKP